MEELRYCQFIDCGRPLPPRKLGKKPRSYCSDAHRKQAHRQRMQYTCQGQLRQAWSVLPADAQQALEQLLSRYGRKATQLAWVAIQASYRDNDNVFWLLRHFSQAKKL